MVEPSRRAHRPIVAVGLKAYLGYRQSLDWLASASGLCREFADSVDIVVFPVAPVLPAAVAIGQKAGFQVGAQDVSDRPSGPYTGEIPAELLRELGVDFVEIGHAERRSLYGESNELIRRKLLVAAEQGLTPLICVGEGRLGSTIPIDPQTALEEAAAQLTAALPGSQTPSAAGSQTPSSAGSQTLSSAGSQTPYSAASTISTAHPASAFVVAYEPVWAIGANQPAPVEHVRAVTAGLRRILSAFPAAQLIYGGTAGPGLFGQLGESIDGLFLGRRAHDPVVFGRVLAEVAAEQ